MITITLFSSKHILSRFIQFILGKPVSHAAIGFNDNNVPSVIHSAYGGIQITTMEKMLSTHKIFAEFEILADMDEEMTDAKKRIGEPYDTIGLFGYLLVLLARKFNIGIKNPLASKSATVCSELIIQLDKNKEIPEFQNIDSETTTPRDLFDICSNGKSFRRIK